MASITVASVLVQIPPILKPLPKRSDLAVAEGIAITTLICAAFWGLMLWLTLSL